MSPDGLWTEASLQQSSLSSAPCGAGAQVTAVERSPARPSPRSASHTAAMPGGQPHACAHQGMAGTSSLELLLLLVHVLNYTD